MFEILNSVNDFLWSYIVLGLLVICALFFTFGLKGVQFFYLGEMWRQLMGSTGKKTDANGERQIGGFQAFAVSLSSRVGTGNLAGVASAIFIGGPGAIFWMWVMALLGGATAFVEATLAQLYKRKGKDAFYGGPAYYMEHGLHRRWMGVLFAILITITFGLANQIVQSNTLCDALSSSVQQDIATNTDIQFIRYVIGAILTLATLVIIFGGIKRISRFSSVMVPIMAIGYLILSVIIIAMNITSLPEVIRLIIENAFGFEQAAGGTIGMTIMMGVKRGLFSNEAGEGSAPNAAAIAHTSHPVKQGLLQALGVFTDTLLICTCTAFIILIAGLYNGDSDGIILTTISLEAEVGVVGRYFVTAAIFLFAYSTIIANYFYGETNIHFITRNKWAIFAFRILSGIVVLSGAFLTLETAFSIVDICMGVMTIVNLVAIVQLFPKVRRLLADYKQQQRAGKDPVFKKSALPAIEQEDIECWE